LLAPADFQSAGSELGITRKLINMLYNPWKINFDFH